MYQRRRRIYVAWHRIAAPARQPVVNSVRYFNYRNTTAGASKTIFTTEETSYYPLTRYALGEV